MANLSPGAAPNIISAPLLSEDRVTQITVAYSSTTAIAATTTVAVSFSVNGVLPGDSVMAVNFPSQPLTGLVQGGAFVSAAGTVTVMWGNVTSTSQNIPTGNYLFTMYRPNPVMTKTLFEG
jgi:hypothetical protein